MSQAVTDSKTRVMDDASMDKVALSENALNVLKARYLIKDETGKCTEAPCGHVSAGGPRGGRCRTPL